MSQPKAPQKQRPVAIFNPGQLRRSNPELCKEFGDYNVQFERACNLEPGTLIHIDLQADEPLPPADQFSAVIISGSAAMITDRHPWALRAADWIRQYRTSTPMIGICFGHQLIADALGGEIGANPIGPRYGTFSLPLAQAAQDDPLFHEMSENFAAQSAHFQTVTKMPKGAELIVGTPQMIQAVRFEDNIWGLQFHPEFTPEFLAALIRSIEARLAKHQIVAEKQINTLYKTHEAQSLLAKFLAHSAALEARRDME